MLTYSRGRKKKHTEKNMNLFHGSLSNYLNVLFKVIILLLLFLQKNGNKIDGRVKKV